MAETKPQKRKSHSRDADRRCAPRHDAKKLGKLITRVIGGGEVKLLDFSRTGVLIASDARLTIGAKATIRLTTTDATLIVRGHVVRSRVASVNGSIVYHTALALDDDLAVLEKSMPVSQKESKSESRGSREADAVDDAGAGPAGSEHASWFNPDTGVGASVDPILEFLATVPHDLAELRRRAAVNNW